MKKIIRIIKKGSKQPESPIQSPRQSQQPIQSPKKKGIRVIGVNTKPGNRMPERQQKDQMRHNNSDNFNQQSAPSSENKKQLKQSSTGKPIATKPIQSLLDIPNELIAKKAGDDFNQRIYKKDIIKQVPLKARNNIKSVQIPIRIPSCQSLECIFNYQVDQRFYQCSECSSKPQCAPKEMVFDWRLANLLNEATTFMDKVSSVTVRNFYLVLSNGVLSILNKENNELFTESDWIQNQWNQQNPEKLCFEMENFMVNQLYGVVKQTVKKFDDLPSEYNKIQDLLRSDSASIEQNLMHISDKKYQSIFNRMQNPGTFNYQYDDKTNCSSIVVILQKQEIALRKYPVISDSNINAREKIGRQRLNRIWFMDNVNNIYSFGDGTKNLYIYRFQTEKESFKEEVYLKNQHLDKFSANLSSAVFLASTSQLFVAHINQKQDLRTIYKFKLDGKNLISQSDELFIPLKFTSIKAILGLDLQNQKQKVWYACHSNKDNSIEIMTEEYDAESDQYTIQPQFEQKMNLPSAQFNKGIFFYMFLQQNSYLGLMTFGRNAQGKLGTQTNIIKVAGKGQEKSLLSLEDLVPYDTTQQVYTVHPSGIVNHQSTRLLVKGKKTQMIAFYSVGSSITARKITV